MQCIRFLRMNLAGSPIKLQTVSLSPHCRRASPRPQPLSYLSTRTLQAPCPLRIYHNVHEHGLAASNTTSSWSQTRCWPRSTQPRTSSCRTSPVSVSASSRPPSPLLSQRVAAAQPGRSGTASGDWIWRNRSSFICCYLGRILCPPKLHHVDHWYCYYVSVTSDMPPWGVGELLILHTICDSLKNLLIWVEQDQKTLI